MNTNLDRYIELFQGRADVYAEQHPDASYSPIWEPVTRGVYETHLRGGRTFGIYPVTRSNYCKFLCFDVDVMDPIPRNRIYGALREMGVTYRNFILEMSGNKGFHIWLPFEYYCPASAARRAGLAVLQLADIKCEVFPKQGTLEGKELGNLIKLPLGIHRVSDQPSRLLGKWTEVQPLASRQVYELADHYEEKPRPVLQPVDTSKLDGFARNMLTKWVAKVAEAPDGQRNVQLNQSGWNLYRLVPGGYLREQDVDDNLWNAAEAAGLLVGDEYQKTVRTLASAKRAGMANPTTPRSSNA